jgi:hypothetical protein
MFRSATIVFPLARSFSVIIRQLNTRGRLKLRTEIWFIRASGQLASIQQSIPILTNLTRNVG